MSNYALHGDRFARCEHCGGIKGRMETPLTQKQFTLYAYLYEFAEQKGFAPSFEEIATAFEYRSLATVHEHLINLERKGWIMRRYNEARGLQCLVPLAGNALAASPEGR